MKKNHEFILNNLVTFINPKAAQELEAANADIDWPVPVQSTARIGAATFDWTLS